MARTALFLIALLAPTACGSTAPGTPRTLSDVITQEEIAASNATTAYETVQQLRPQYLRSRGPSSLQFDGPLLPIIYIDNVASGGPDVLRSISAAEVSEIRYISAADATTRYGTGHTGGVIQVKLRRQQAP